MHQYPSVKIHENMYNNIHRVDVYQQIINKTNFLLSTVKLYISVSYYNYCINACFIIKCVYTFYVLTKYIKQIK